MKIHHLEFYVGSGLQTTQYYKQALGLEETYYKGLQTQERHQCTRVIENDDQSVVFTLTSAINGSSQNDLFYEKIKKHGDHVHDIALVVDDHVEALVQHINALDDSSHAVFKYKNNKKIAIVTPPHNVTWQHTIIQKEEAPLYFEKAGFEARKSAKAKHLVDNVDHVAFAVPQIQPMADWYSKAFSLKRFMVNDDDDAKEGLAIKGIRTLSMVPSCDTISFRFVFVEPKAYERRSQISEFLEYHEGAGVAHAALHTQNIFEAVSNARLYGVPFIDVPLTYYEIAKTKSSLSKIDLEKEIMVKENRILIDGHQDDAEKPFDYLLQTFSHPLVDRPTFYLELISRQGATGFGSGNITHLFKAIEQLQLARGNG
mmetsp:Transcript_8682/g.12827  ORF Transcript_8682/g.12827 Transcript_8682/m.12827 type:complete len:371 (+) Transcript_8682:17-1129(+)